MLRLSFVLAAAAGLLLMATVMVSNGPAEGTHGCTLYNSYQTHDIIHGPNHWHNWPNPGVFHTRTIVRAWIWYAPNHVYVQTSDVVDEGYPDPPGWWKFQSGYGFCG